MSNEKVNPNHYKQFSVEIYEMMEKIWGREAFVSHCEMTAFKYKMRAGSKQSEDPLVDLEKAKWYLDKARQNKELPF